MWSAHQKKVVRLAIKLQPSSIQHNYQGQWQGRQLLSLPSPRWSQRSSQSIRTPMNPKLHMGLAVNIQLCHPASLISTCRPTHSMCWLQWPWFERMNSRARNHRSHPTRFQFRRPHWMWVPLKAGRQRTQPRMTKRFILTMSPDKSIGIFFSSDTFDSNEPRNVSIPSIPSSTPPPPRRQKRKLSMGMSFPKKEGMWQHTSESCSQPLPAKKTP